MVSSSCVSFDFGEYFRSNSMESFEKSFLKIFFKLIFLRFFLLSVFLTCNDLDEFCTPFDALLCEFEIEFYHFALKK